MTESYGDCKTHENAAAVFNREVARALVIHELTRVSEGARLIGVFSKTKTEQIFRVVTRRKTIVYSIEAASLKHALAFEKRPREQLNER